MRMNLEGGLLNDTISKLITSQLAILTKRSYFKSYIQLMIIFLKNQS
jgi:hypothetical protein